VSDNSAVIRDRVVELRRVPASDLRANPLNPRRHPESQRSAMSSVLEQIGFAGALLARELDDGALELLDGHLRTDLAADQLVPVLITDLDDDEARVALATYDELTLMAERDRDMMRDLLASISKPSPELQETLTRMAYNYVEAPPPPDFPEFGDDLETAHKCPSCGYRWS
jgi:hypothetical protein